MDDCQCSTQNGFDLLSVKSLYQNAPLWMKFKYYFLLSQMKKLYKKRVLPLTFCCLSKVNAKCVHCHIINACCYIQPDYNNNNEIEQKKCCCLQTNDHKRWHERCWADGQ